MYTLSTSYHISYIPCLLSHYLAFLQTISSVWMPHITQVHIQLAKNLVIIQEAPSTLMP